MRTGSKAAALACAAALIIPIAFVPSCSTGQNPIRTRPEAEQNLNRIRTEIEKTLLTGENVVRQINAAEVAEDARSLTVGASEGFALWVRGRLALSSGTGSDELLFEVDPASGRTRMWTSVAVDGAVTVAGDLAVRGIASSGTVSARAFEAARAALESVQANTVESERVLADVVEAGSVEGNTVAAHQMVMEALAARSAEVADLVSGKLEAREVHAGTLASETLTASSGRLDVLEALSATIANMAATSMSAQSLTGEAVEAADVRANHVGVNSVEAGALHAGELSGEALDVANAAVRDLVSETARIDELACRLAECSSISVENLGATAIEAASARIASLEADEVQANRVNTAELEADEVSAGSVTADRLAGTLAVVHPGPGFAGVVVFPAIDAPEAGTVTTCEIEVDSRVDGMVVTPSVQDGCPCFWEVEEVGEGRWAISRTFAPGVEPAPVGETEVYWLAFDLG